MLAPIAHIQLAVVTREPRYGFMVSTRGIVGWRSFATLILSDATEPFAALKFSCQSNFRVEDATGTSMLKYGAVEIDS